MEETPVIEFCYSRVMKSAGTCILVMALLMPLTAWGQDGTFNLNVNVDLVELHVTVVDSKDRPVGNLKQEQFTILEDRVAQPVAVFKHEDIPLSMGMLIDNSGSMRNKKARVHSAAVC